MAEIRTDFPFGYTDKELNSTIRDLSDHVVRNRVNINTVLQFVPLITLGQNELQNRKLNKSSEENSRISKIALAISIFSLIMSFVAVYFAFRSDLTSDSWQKEQLRILENIEYNMHK